LNNEPAQSSGHNRMPVARASKLTDECDDE
jgi:hypothetical protein